MSLPIALQLYTIREPMKNDVEGTLKAVADIGYQYVELAGLYGRTPEQMKALLDDLGLKAMASHDSLDRVANELDTVVAQAETLGYDLIVCPNIPGPKRNPEGFHATAAALSEAASKVKAQGLSVCYHNHAFEFEPADGTIGMDILANEATGVQFELDLYWVARGGHDPFAWMKKLTGRLPILHVKDMEDSPEQRFAEVGTGTLDLKGMVEQAPGHGARYLVIEQDSNWGDGDALKSARIGFENLSAWLR